MRISPQTRLLSRTFFSRLFESDLMPPGLPQVQLVIAAIAFFAAPALGAPILLVRKYIEVGDPVLLRAMIAQDRMMLLLVCIVATAVVTLAIWENIFPDRRDSRHLGVLPIPMRSFVAARLTALVALFALVFVGSTVLLSVTFGAVDATFSGAFFPGVVVRQFLVTAGAEAFVFFGIIGLQCALLNTAGPSATRQLIMGLQVALVVVVLQLPLLLPPREAFLAPGGASPGWTSLGLAGALPSLWFLALYECLGSTCGAMRPLATTAAAVAILAPALAVALYALSYRRLTRLAIEGRPTSRRRRRLLATVIGWWAAHATRSTASAAVCLFTLRTFARSRQHRMLLAGWIGVAIALIVSPLLPLVLREGAVPFDRPHAAVLAAPLILCALTLTGMRMLIALPSEISANWTFRLREPLRVADAVNGAASALILCGVVPPVILAFTSASWLWGNAIAAQHALFCALMGWIAVQVLMRGVDKVPFTCTYCPGKAQITKFWPAYFSAFSIFTYSAAYLEARLLRYPRAYLFAVIALTVAGTVVAYLRRADAAQLVNLRFEEEPLDSVTVVPLYR